MGFRCCRREKRCFGFIPLKLGSMLIAIYALLYIGAFTTTKTANPEDDCSASKVNDTTILGKVKKYSDPVYHASSILLAVISVGLLFSILKDFHQILITSLFVVILLLVFVVQEATLILDLVMTLKSYKSCGFNVSATIAGITTLPFYIYYAIIVNSYSLSLSPETPGSEPKSHSESKSSSSGGGFGGLGALGGLDPSKGLALFGKRDQLKDEMKNKVTQNIAGAQGSMLTWLMSWLGLW